jgi:simple sugar transport system substrate-binding protein
MNLFISRNKPLLALASVACASVLVLGTAMYGASAVGASSKSVVYRGAAARPSVKSSGISLTVGAVYLDAEGFYGGIEAGIKTAGKQYGLHLLQENVEADAATEASFMGSLIAANVAGIVTSPVSVTSSAPAIIEAVKKGIPVVCYNTCLTTADTAKYVKSFVTSNQYAMGVSDGKYAVSYFKSKHMTDPEIGIINCAVFEACLQRDQGFEKTLKAGAPGAKIVTNQEAIALDDTTSTAEEELVAHPDLAAIYGDEESAAEGAVLGIIAKKHQGETVVFGSDITVEEANYMLKYPKILLATVG